MQEISVWLQKICQGRHSSIGYVAASYIAIVLPDGPCMAAMLL